MADGYVRLNRHENQAQGLARYAIAFCHGEYSDPDSTVFAKTSQFHGDSVACAVAALASRANAPRVLRDEALSYAVDDSKRGATCFGSPARVRPEKAVLANCAAVRELDANGTNFGFNPRTGNARGEFGHNDFYPVAIAAAQLAGWDGWQALRAMICLDEIRGRLAEVFALKDHKIDHVVHGAIASAAVYGAVLGATPVEIESAIGLVLAHYIPFRAIRAGQQLSDSKGASAAFSAEMAVISVDRAVRGFRGPADIFRNPQAIFCLFEPPAAAGQSPFDLELATHGADFAVMGMHFKLGLYEHQSAGAIQGLMDVLAAHRAILEDMSRLERVRIQIYEPAFSIIADPAKRDPQNRQSADHSMSYIIATLLRKAFQTKTAGWSELMLMPEDYSESALRDPTTRQLMGKIELAHGGPEFDARYPEGIPTLLEIDHADLGRLSSGLVMYPEGHARSQSPSKNLSRLLEEKFRRLAALGVSDPDELMRQFMRMDKMTAEELQRLYTFSLRQT